MKAPTAAAINPTTPRGTDSPSHHGALGPGRTGGVSRSIEEGTVTLLGVEHWRSRHGASTDGSDHPTVPARFPTTDHTCGPTEPKDVLTSSVEGSPRHWLTRSPGSRTRSR